MRLKSEKRLIKMTIRVTEAEREEIARRAADAGIGQPMRYVREMALRRLRHSADRTAINQLVRVGNNLNQLVRTLHQAHAGGPKRLATEVEERLEDIDVAIHQILTRVEALRVGAMQNEPEAS